MRTLDGTTVPEGVLPRLKDRRPMDTDTEYVLRQLLQALTDTDRAVARAWAQLSPTPDPDGNLAPGSELVPTEPLAEFFAAATIFLRATQEVGRAALAAADGQGRGRPGPEEADDASPEAVQAVLERAGVVKPIAWLKGLDPDQRRALLSRTLEKNREAAERAAAADPQTVC